MGAHSSQGPPKDDVEHILAEFELREPVLVAFCARTKTLIEACLQDAGIRYQSVQARVKTKKKLREKYLSPDKDYRRLDDITDLAGLRVITYYDDEVDRVANVIEQEFQIDKKESVDKRDIEPDRFGYRAVNFICGHKAARTKDVEYKRFAGVLCEVQITSILGHAWSEIEHEWYDLREAYPDDVKRRFSILAALFELAGREFVDIRNSRAKYERAVALQVEANVPDVPVDAVLLKSFIEQEPSVAEIDSAAASALGFTLVPAGTFIESRSKAIRSVGITKVQDLRAALARFGSTIPEFLKRCRTEVWPNAPRSSKAEAGVCIYHLALLIAAGRGEDDLSAFFKLMGGSHSYSEVKQIVSIANEMMTKHQG